MAGRAHGRLRESFLAIPTRSSARRSAPTRSASWCATPRTGRLANRFVLTANIEASDGGTAIVAGNERVIRARLSDALYFWQTDQKPLPDFEDKGKPLDQRMAKLRALNVVFHEKLGTQGERVDRIKALARHIAPQVGADPDLAERAAELAKADLMTEVVGEFRRSRADGAEIRAAPGRARKRRRRHRGPLQAAGPSDRVPTDKVAVPWHWGTSWIRWWASGPSTRSRRGARIRSR